MPETGSNLHRKRGISGPGFFATTHWSVVLTAGQSSNPASREALEQLCRAYWYPLYVFVRRRGYLPEDAQDLTQGFFQRLLERDLLAKIVPTGARFRAYLLHALKNHLASEWTRQHADKRGGGKTILSLDELSPELRYTREPTDHYTPESAYERRWAAAVLNRALDQLRREQVDAGKGEWFELLVNRLTGEPDSRSCAEMGSRLGMSEAAVKMALHRLRRRYGELLRHEVAQTVLSPGEIDQELRHLLSVLAGERGTPDELSRRTN